MYKLRAALLIFLHLSPCLAHAGDFHLQAADGRGVLFDSRSLHGQAIALIFASRYTRQEASRINERLRAQVYPGQVNLVTVVNFIGIPRIFHGYARRKILESDLGKTQVPSNVQNPSPPRDEAGGAATRQSLVPPVLSRVLVDTDGRISQSLGIHPERSVEIFLINRDGALAGRFTGEVQLAEALRVLEQLSKG